MGAVSSYKFYDAAKKRLELIYATVLENGKFSALPFGVEIHVKQSSK